MPKVTDVTVERRSHSDEEYCLAWKLKGDAYHVWLEKGTFKLKPGVGTGGRAIYKHLTKPAETLGGNRALATKIVYLDQNVPKNKLMVDDAIVEAISADLFKQCDAKLAAEEKERLAQAAEEYKVTLAKEAGPELLAALQALWGSCREHVDSLACSFAFARTLREQVQAAIKLATEVK